MSAITRGRRIGNLYFSGTEIRDLLVAWVALGVAFALFFVGGAAGIDRIVAAGVVLPLAVSLVTAGTGFLLHEVAHKAVAVRYDQVAEFRADRGMLFLAVMSALLGFIFAAPGAVYHRGRVTPGEQARIALAGPAVNAALLVVFVPVFFVGGVLGNEIVTLVGERGVAINVFLAAFNLIPYGPLDGRTVYRWSRLVWAITFVPAALLTGLLVFVFGLGFSGPF